MHGLLLPNSREWSRGIGKHVKKPSIIPPTKITSHVHDGFQQVTLDIHTFQSYNGPTWRPSCESEGEKSAQGKIPAPIMPKEGPTPPGSHTNRPVPTCAREIQVTSDSIPSLERCIHFTFHHLIQWKLILNLIGFCCKKCTQRMKAIQSVTTLMN